MIQKGVDISKNELNDDIEMDEAEYKKLTKDAQKNSTVKVIVKWDKGYKGFKDEKISGKVISGFGLSCL